VIIDLRAVRAVVLPGTGSDDDYITRAFGRPLRDDLHFVLLAKDI